MADQQQQTQPDPFSSADSADSSPVATVRILPVEGVKRSGYVLGKRALKLSTLDRAHRTARESLELVNLNTQAAKETVEAAALISGGLKLLTDATVKTVEALAEGATREQKPPTNVWDALKAGAEAIGATMQGDAGRRLIGRLEEAVGKYLGPGEPAPSAAAGSPAAPPAGAGTGAPSPLDDLLSLPPELREDMTLAQVREMRSLYIAEQKKGYAGTWGEFALALLAKHEGANP